jgi:drug/metabolite transporter (DMT)-like permease
MPFGLLAGLGAALSWGTMDIAGALAARRIGSLLVTAGVVVVSATWFALATAIVQPGRVIGPGGTEASILLGLIGAGAYLSYFTGLRVGPISVVSGTVAAYGGLTVVLSVILRGESLTLGQAAGATIATVGVILTGVAFDGSVRGTRFAGPGVVFAVIALVLFAFMAITTDVALESADALQVLVISRGVTAVASLAVVAAILMVRPRSVEAGPVDPADPLVERGRVRTGAGVVTAVIVAGSLDVLGLASFTIGLETAPTWMVGLASSFGPAVTIIVAVAILGERLRPVQWLGLLGVAIGMVAIALP